MRRSRAGLILLMLSLLASCARPSDGPKCSTAQLVTPVPLPTPRPVHRKLIYGLIDRSGSYYDLTERAVKTLSDTLSLPGVLAPGDRVFISWIGADSAEPDTTFFADRVPPVQPQAPPPHEPPPPAPGPGAPSTACIAYKTLVDGYNTRIQDWNSRALEPSEAQEIEETDAVQTFLDKLQQQLKRLPRRAPDAGTSICDALVKAASIIATPLDGVEWSAWHLVIFSDMWEYPATGMNKCRNLSELNLSGVDVIIAMHYCGDKDPRGRAECERQKPQWEQILQGAGATLPLGFLRVESSNPETLARYLR